MQDTVPETEGQYWWVWVVGGVVNILFGLMAIFWPGLTLLVFVWLFGFYALVYGIVEAVAMFRAMSARTTWWTHLLVALFSVGAGVVILLYPGITTFSLLVAIAIWAIVVGVVEVVAGFAQANFLVGILGVISILFGFVLLANPALGALALVWVIGAFAIVRGILELLRAFRLPAQAPTPR